ncbi:DoxX family protein [Microbacterium lushaniae]|uniref:DoxX-like family protein n=1 Tax=Microbacterium lushaniae TaxID=2614639 RepID=A0A5J6L0E3_9MICO|nr:DoxX family protein [Microbacterium lushaniae]QEW01958.1 hypothetical protein F6J85_01820 [Microbacterium lushaniae]
MWTLPDPVWPVIVLAAIQLVDGLMCLRPASFIARCLEGVKWPRRYWRLMPPIKFAAAAGLIAGIWIPYLGAVTSGALVLYFAVAVAMHIRARYLGRDFYLNALGMLTICVATFVFCFAL